ncbi:MAG: serine protease [Chthoniobacteraceae bacterium]
MIKTYHNSLVFASGKEGAGSGFIATLGNANFLFTNAHVEAGITGVKFKSLDGTDLQAGEASIAVGEDVFCMALQGNSKPFEIMQGVDANASIGDAVVVLGNAEGGGVVNTIIGKIVGIGPNLVEIDAQFVPGNSGSPIIHIKTGKVIGVATYSVTRKYNVTTNEKMRKPEIRRFGYRLDTVKKWQPVNWQSFNAQASRMKDIEALTDDLYDFFVDLSENKNSVTAGWHTNPVIKTRIDQWVAGKSRRLSASDAQLGGRQLPFVS